MSKVRFMCIDPTDEARYKFRDEIDNIFLLYTDGRYGNIEGVNPAFWEKFYCANVIDINCRVIDGENVIIKVNHIR